MNPETFLLLAIFIAPLPVMILTGGRTYGDDMTNYPGWYQESNVVPIGKHRAWADHVETALIQAQTPLTPAFPMRALLPVEHTPLAEQFDDLIWPLTARRRPPIRPTWTALLAVALLAYVGGWVVASL